MLINALCGYYDILAKQGKIMPKNYSTASIHYLVSLTPSGEIDDIIDWRVVEEFTDKKGKVKERLVPREVVYPRRLETSCIKGQFLDYRPAYIFGLNYDKKTDVLTPYDSTEKAIKSHRAFVEKQIECFNDIDTPIVNAYKNFINNWNPESETQNVFLLAIKKSLETSKFAFCLSGRPDILLHEDELVNARWRKISEDTEVMTDDTVQSQCCITGEVSAIAKTHNKIKGISGANATGCSLVCCNNASEESYGQKQSCNSNISEATMEKYTQALNYLTSGNKHKTYLDDVTIVHWAMSEDEKYDELASLLMFDDSKMDSAEVDVFLKSLALDTKDAAINAERLSALNEFDPNVDFYFTGLKPNSSRLAVKFCYRRKFDDVIKNVVQHTNDMAVRSNSRPIPLWRIKKELISPKSKNDNINPALLTGLFNAILNGTDYPHALLANIVARIKTDSDDEDNNFIKMNDTRIGILKACINRKSRILGQEEEITLALNKENTNQAYLCGRLFAILESIQRKASNYQLKKTIKETFFASAASRPATIFPNLIRQSNYHLTKLKEPKYFTDEIKEVVDLLGESFPDTLSLTEQGKFMIGYYQQKSYTDEKIKNIQEANNNGNK